MLLFAGPMILGNLHPAVSDEFWNPDDTGSGQQLWNRSHGGIRSGCED